MKSIQQRLDLTPQQHWLMYYIFVEGRTQAKAAKAVGIPLHTATTWLTSIRYRASAITKDGKRVNNNTQLAYIAGTCKMTRPSTKTAHVTDAGAEALSEWESVARDEVERAAALVGVPAPP